MSNKGPIDEFNANELSTLLSGRTVKGLQFPSIISGRNLQNLVMAAKEKNASSELKEAVSKLEKVHDAYHKTKNILLSKQKKDESISRSDLEALIEKAASYAKTIEEMVQATNKLPLTGPVVKDNKKVALTSEPDTSSQVSKVPFQKGRSELLANIREGKALKKVEAATSSQEIIGYTTSLTESEFNEKIEEAKDYGADAVLKEHLIPVYANQKNDFTGSSTPLHSKLANELDSLSKDTDGNIQFWSKSQQKETYKAQTAQKFSPQEAMKMAAAGKSMLSSTSSEKQAVKVEKGVSKAEPPAPSPRSPLSSRKPPVPPERQPAPPSRSPLQSRKQPTPPKREQQNLSQYKTAQEAADDLRKLAGEIEATPETGDTYPTKSPVPLRLRNRDSARMHPPSIKSPIGLDPQKIHELKSSNRPSVFNPLITGNKSAIEEGKQMRANYEALSFLSSPEIMNMEDLFHHAHRSGIWGLGESLNPTKREHLTELQDFYMMLNFEGSFKDLKTQSSTPPWFEKLKNYPSTLDLLNGIQQLSKADPGYKLALLKGFLSTFHEEYYGEGSKRLQYKIGALCQHLLEAIEKVSPRGQSKSLSDCKEQYRIFKEQFKSALKQDEKMMKKTRKP